MSNRLELFNQILKYSADQHIKLNRFWGSFVETTRFKLGESIKDIKVPFALDSESTTFVAEALKDFFEFLKRRSESQFKALTDHSIDDVVGEIRLAPKTYQVRFFRKDSIEHAITTRALLHDPLLDAGLFETWLSSKSSGQNLIAVIRGIYQKALTEEFKSEHLEKTAYIQHLGFLKHLNQAKSTIKKGNIKGLTYEQIDILFGNVVYILTDIVLATLIEQMRTKPIPQHILHSILLITSTCHPFSFISIKQSMLRAKTNPYNLSQETSDALDAIYRNVSQEDTELEYVYPAMVKSVLNNPKIKNPLLEEATISALRRSILEFLFENDNPSVALPSRLRSVIQDQASLYDFVFNGKEVDQLADQLKKQIKLEAKEERRSTQMAEIEDILRFVQKGSASRKGSVSEQLVEQAIFRYLTYKIDLYLDPFSTEALGFLENRQLKLTVPQLKQDYESGRLYRISSDSRPALKEFSERLEGQLFIDLKDFTKRTQYSKEIVMADFLGSEFYKPILEAAKKYYAHGEFGQKTIRLTNLLGDAVIFSGSIEHLVHLAHDIHNIFKEYRNKLKANSPVNLETELKSKLEQKYKADSNKTTEAINQTTQVIKEIKEGINLNLRKNHAFFIGQFETQMNQEIGVLENEFIDLDGRIQLENSEQKRYEIMSRKNAASQKLTDLRGLNKQFVEQFEKMTPDRQATLLARFFFRDKIKEISNFEDYLDNLQKRKNYLKYEFERELKKIEGFGIEAGLFISYGAASETVNLQDEVWGDQKVDIAETINESARGTARNPMIKKLLDARLTEQARSRNKPDLASPFSVYVEDIYSFQLGPQHNNDLTAAFKNSDRALAEQVFLNMYHEGLKDVRNQIQNPEAHEERRHLILFSDIYNEGSAISEDALDSFLKETATGRMPLRKNYPVRKFHQEILDKFMFMHDSCQFIMSLDLERPTYNPLIFRFAGRAIFKGFETKGSIGVYEMLKSDSPFYSLLMQHHFPDWLEEIPELKRN